MYNRTITFQSKTYHKKFPKGKTVYESQNYHIYQIKFITFRVLLFL